MTTDRHDITALFAADDRPRIVMNRAPDCRVHLRSDPESMFVTLACANHRTIPTRSRDVSDPRTDPGVRVRGLEVGSLTSRLLSTTVCAPAKTAAALRWNPRGSLSAKFRSIFSYAHVPRSRGRQLRADGRADTPLRRGEVVPPAPSPPPPPLSVVSGYLAEGTINGFVVRAKIARRRRSDR